MFIDWNDGKFWLYPPPCYFIWWSITYSTKYLSWLDECIRDHSKLKLPRINNKVFRKILVTCFACQIFVLKSQFKETQAFCKLLKSVSSSVPCVRAKKKLSKKIAQWSSVGVNIFQTANYCKLLAIRWFSYGKRLVSVRCVSDASAFGWVFSLQIFGPVRHRVRRSVRCLNAKYPFIYFDDINTHIAGDVKLGFYRQLTTFVKESLRRLMTNLNSNRI